jgi:hypothetical protein
MHMKLCVYEYYNINVAELLYVSATFCGHLQDGIQEWYIKKTSQAINKYKMLFF